MPQQHVSNQRFTLVTGDFVPTGGMDRANYALASYLARSGHPVTLVAHRVAPELQALPGIMVRRTWKPLGSNFLGQWPLARAGRAVGAVGGRVVVNGGNCPFPDVNWVHYVHAAYRPDVPASHVGRLKAWLDRPLSMRAERAALRTARVVVCNSELTRRHVAELCGTDSCRAVTIYYGSDPQRFCPATPCQRAALRDRLGWGPDRPVVLFLGALGDRRKGFDTLLAAWGRLCQSPGWDALLAVVGSGVEKTAWQARAEAAGLSDRIRFLGFRSDVADILRAGDALAAPTRYEAYGLGVHEALCCGLPALVSAASGIAERYPPELSDMLLPDPDDATDLAMRLGHWRADLDGWRQRVQPLSAKLRGYSWDDMSRRFLEVCA